MTTASAQTKETRPEPTAGHLSVFHRDSSVGIVHQPVTANLTSHRFFAPAAYILHVLFFSATAEHDSVGRTEDGMGYPLFR